MDLPKDTVCEGEPLFVNNYSLNANNYQWKFMYFSSLSEALPPRSETIKTGFYVVFPSSGQYVIQLTAFNELNCKDTATRQITVLPAPKIHDITAVPDSGQAFPFQNIQFTPVHTSPVSPNTFLWTFGDNTGSVNTELASHIYTNAGLYPVQLVLTNSTGCRDTFVLQMRIIDTDSLFVPNIVTPGNDGKNDVFRVKHKNLKTYHIDIFNRWGNKVYESDNPNEVWDPVKHQDGVYYYVIVAQGTTGINYNKKGNITVLR
jgi:gliding motility-associated-like protein